MKKNEWCQTDISLRIRYDVQDRVCHRFMNYFSSCKFDCLRIGRVLFPEPVVPPYPHSIFQCSPTGDDRRDECPPADSCCRCLVTWPVRLLFDVPNATSLFFNSLDEFPIHTWSLTFSLRVSSELLKIESEAIWIEEAYPLLLRISIHYPRVWNSTFGTNRKFGVIEWFWRQLLILIVVFRLQPTLQ
jgi:hypothetical protein